MKIKSFHDLNQYFTDEMMVRQYVAKRLEADHIRTSFPKEIEELVAGDFGSINHCNRKDLTDESSFTIDCSETQDMDDAISVSKSEDGYLVRVHIADVASYVGHGSGLEAEAMLRGSSVYLPGITIPMLPPVLTNELCSLNPGVNRNAITAEILIDGSGDVISYKLFKSIIRSRVKGVYSEVNALLAGMGGATLRKKYSEVHDEIIMLDELATKLNKKRIANGAVTGCRPFGAARFVNGQVVIEARENGRAESLVEELMILANTVVAEFFVMHDMPAVMRSQAKQGELAEYTDGRIGHSSLALSHYVHFTSPIRRFADLRVHQILSDKLDGATTEELKGCYADCMEETYLAATKGARRARSIQNACNKYAYCKYMSKRSNERFTGEVVGRDCKGRYLVRLKDLGISVIASRIANAREGLKLVCKVGVDFDNNIMYARCISTLAA